MGTYDVYSSSIDAVTTIIQGLGLSGIDSDDIIAGKMPDDNDEEFLDALPAVVVSPVGAEEIQTYSNQSDVYVYPIIIVMLAADNHDKDKQPIDLSRLAKPDYEGVSQSPYTNGRE